MDGGHDLLELRRLDPGAISALRDRVERPREAARGPVEIRRFATVVNSDLKGSTALGERLDPETLREVLTLYFDEMRLVFESHGGTIEKIIGDAIVAVFGLPVRHDDDAASRGRGGRRDTARAGRPERPSSSRPGGCAWSSGPGSPPAIVTFGEASIGQHVLTGDTMAISSAMEQNAPPLEVLIAGSTYDLVRDIGRRRTGRAGHARREQRGASGVPSGLRRGAAAGRACRGRHRGRRAASLSGLRRGEPGVVPACAGCAAPSWRRRRRSATAARPSRSCSPTRSRPPLDGVPPSPEALRDVMTRYFEAMRVPLEAHGGTVERFIGDAVMAVFGLPVRHEDDALRAVRARGRDAGRPTRPQRPSFRLDFGHGDRQPHRRQHAAK